MWHGAVILKSVLKIKRRRDFTESIGFPEDRDVRTGRKIQGSRDVTRIRDVTEGKGI